MKHNDAINEFIRLADIRLTPKEHEEIWDSIERDMEYVPIKKRIPRPTKIWGSNIAIVATIAVVIGGIATYHYDRNLGVSNASPSKDAAYTHIGNLKLGETISQVKKIYGNPTKKGDAWQYSKRGIKLYGDPVHSISVSPPFSGALPSGIHIGSSQKVVQEAYPGSTINSGPDGSGIAIFKVTSPDKNYLIQIVLRDNTVTSIGVDTKDVGVHKKNVGNVIVQSPPAILSRPKKRVLTASRQLVQDVNYDEWFVVNRVVGWGAYNALAAGKPSAWKKFSSSVVLKTYPQKIKRDLKTSGLSQHAQSEISADCNNLLALYAIAQNHHDKTGAQALKLYHRVSFDILDFLGGTTGKAYGVSHVEGGYSKVNQFIRSVQS